MQPHEIKDNDVREIDWRTIIPEIGIEPMNDMQAVDWVGDMTALKMGPGVFIRRMSTWPDPYRKGAPPKYMMEDSIPDNFEGITPNGKTSYAERSVASLTRSPDWNGQPVKIPKIYVISKKII